MKKLGQVLLFWRKLAEANIRDTAKEIGISPATLSRIERGEEMDGRTLAKILTWLLEEETL